MKMMTHMLLVLFSKLHMTMMTIMKKSPVSPVRDVSLCNLYMGVDWSTPLVDPPALPAAVAAGRDSRGRGGGCGHRGGGRGRASGRASGHASGSGSVRAPALP
jgi:hypothetical protein